MISLFWFKRRPFFCFFGFSRKKIKGARFRLSQRKLKQQPPASEFPSHLFDDLLCPPPPPLPPLRAAEFPPLVLDDLPRPPPPQPHRRKYLLSLAAPPHCAPMSPETTDLYYSPPPPLLTFAPEFPAPLPPSPVGPPPQPYQPKYLLSPPPPMSPETTDIYYSHLPPPPPLPVFPSFPQPPSTAESSSPAVSSFRMRLLSGLGSAVFIALLVAVWKMILGRNHPVEVEVQAEV